MHAVAPVHAVFKQQLQRLHRAFPRSRLPALRIVFGGITIID